MLAEPVERRQVRESRNSARWARGAGRVGFWLVGLAISALVAYWQSPAVRVLADWWLDPVPRLWVDQREFDFGVVQPGELLRTTVHVTNTGGRPLILRKFAGRCCGPAAAVEIAPHSTYPLLVDIDTTNRTGQDLAQTVTWHTNAPHNQRMQVVFRARLKPFDMDRAQEPLE